AFNTPKRKRKRYSSRASDHASDQFIVSDSDAGNGNGNDSDVFIDDPDSPQASASLNSYNTSSSESDSDCYSVVTESTLPEIDIDIDMPTRGRSRSVSVSSSARTSDSEDLGLKVQQRRRRRRRSGRRRSPSPVQVQDKSPIKKRLFRRRASTSELGISSLSSKSTPRRSERLRLSHSQSPKKATTTKTSGTSKSVSDDCETEEDSDDDNDKVIETRTPPSPTLRRRRLTNMRPSTRHHDHHSTVSDHSGPNSANLDDRFSRIPIPEPNTPRRYDGPNKSVYKTPTSPFKRMRIHSPEVVNVPLETRETMFVKLEPAEDFNFLFKTPTKDSLKPNVNSRPRSAKRRRLSSSASGSDTDGAVAGTSSPLAHRSKVKGFKAKVAPGASAINPKTPMTKLKSVGRSLIGSPMKRLRIRSPSPSPSRTVGESETLETGPDPGEPDVFGNPDVYEQRRGKGSSYDKMSTLAFLVARPFPMTKEDMMITEMNPSPSLSSTDASSQDPSTPARRSEVKVPKAMERPPASSSTKKRRRSEVDSDRKRSDRDTFLNDDSDSVVPDSEVEFAARESARRTGRYKHNISPIVERRGESHLRRVWEHHLVLAPLLTFAAGVDGTQLAVAYTPNQKAVPLNAPTATTGLM
ncbi:hypothetical protein H0H93_006884, partial [Arthromyces matolae]